MIQYDKNKSLITNVLNLFKYSNWLYREMLQGRVAVNREQGEKNANDILQAQADFVQAVEDEYNAVIE